MRSWAKYLSICFGAVLLILSLVIILAMSEPNVKSLSSPLLLNQTPAPDLIVAISEEFVNSILQTELKERQLQGVNNASIYFNKNGPVEILVELRIPINMINIEPKIKVDANLSAKNNTLKVRPESISVGKLNVPEWIWMESVNSALEAAEDSANNALVSNLQKGFMITGVYIGDHYLTLTIKAPPPEELSNVLKRR
jgi:hypothetical protein